MGAPEKKRIYKRLTAYGSKISSKNETVHLGELLQDIFTNTRSARREKLRSRMETIFTLHGKCGGGIGGDSSVWHQQPIQDQIIMDVHKSSNRLAKDQRQPHDDISPVATMQDVIAKESSRNLQHT